MEEDQKVKHICKFCYKCFPCGRSLGGHMRSHLITVNSSSSDQPKRKLPPLTTTKTDDLVEGGGQFGYRLRDNPKKTKKISKKRDQDTLLDEKLCEECGKSFQSWKDLFGHMKCHSKADSWNSSSSDDHQKLIIMENLSDNEATIPLCRRRRSDRTKRYTNSSSLTNFSPCVSEIDDQQEEEEVALSLILLSMDAKNFDCMNSVVESSATSSKFLEAKTECLKFKKQTELKTPAFPRKSLKTSLSADEVSEVNSPKTSIKIDQFGSYCKKKRPSKRKSIDSESNVPLGCKLSVEKNKFTCLICLKAFGSYQALGGHRASHKKFKSCCAPTNDQINTLETDISPNDRENLVDFSAEKIDNKKNKEHECPICFKIFPSGQALGGHKRSHLSVDQYKNTDPFVSTQKPSSEIRNFLDLNLPAPVEEEESNDFNPWWSHMNHHEPLLGLLSS